MIERSQIVTTSSSQLVKSYAACAKKTSFRSVKRPPLPQPRLERAQLTVEKLTRMASLTRSKCWPPPTRHGYPPRITALSRRQILERMDPHACATCAAFFVEMGTNPFANSVHCASLCRLLPLRHPASCLHELLCHYLTCASLTMEPDLAPLTSAPTATATSGLSKLCQQAHCLNQECYSQ
jgi:hypothetical protein